MSDELARWVAHALETSNMTQGALADAIERLTRLPMDKSKVNKMVLGKRAVSAQEMLAISRITGLPIPDGRSNAVTIAVAGRVGAGARVPLADAYEKGDGLFHVACPPQLPARGIVAVEVEGDSMAPMYQPGHILFFSRATHEGVADEDVGHPCVIEDEEGNAWVKLLKRGTAPGLWNLISMNPSAESVWDQRIKWAARVRLALPQDLVERVEV